MARSSSGGGGTGTGSCSGSLLGLDDLVLLVLAAYCQLPDFLPW